MTIKEVATYLSLNKKIAYNLVMDGEIPGFKAGEVMAVLCEEIIE